MKFKSGDKVKVKDTDIVLLVQNVFTYEDDGIEYVNTFYEGNDTEGCYYSSDLELI